MNRFELVIRPNECWWGGRVADGTQMPLDIQSVRTIELCDNKSNQVCPIYLSSQGRSLWSDEPFTLEASHGKIVCRGPGKFVLSETETSLRDAFRAARQRYFPAPHDLPEPLLFTVPQYNTWIELMYDQEQHAILQYAKRLVEEGYPPGVLMIDDNWQEDYGRWDFHPGRFPDPAAMVHELHKLGFKVMLWVCPFVSPDSVTFRQLRDAGALLSNAENEPTMRTWWNGVSAVLDLTAAPAIQWFEQELRALQTQYGIDGFKFDAGDLPFYPEDGHIHCAAFNKFGAIFPLNEFRAAWRSAELPLAQRLADRNHAWDESGLASVIPNLLMQGLLGYPFVCPDMIGGGQFESFLGDQFTVDEELVVRYAQVAALCPMMQFSVAPWRVLNRENAALCKQAAQLHEAVGDEILAIAKACADSGEPMVRSLEYQFPGYGYEHITDQFLLGEEVLVAPVLGPGQRERQVAIPPGEWMDERGTRYTGPTMPTMQVPLDRLCYLRRQS